MIFIDQAALDRALLLPAVEALDSIGRREVATIQSMISIPVGRDLQGNVIKRSDPGDPPRMETGALHDNVMFEIDASGPNPVLDIISSRPGEDQNVPETLEYKLNRPYMSTASDRVHEYVMDELADWYRRSL